MELSPSEKCREVFALLSEYLDMQLPPDACEAVAKHLADCAPCVDFAESLRTTIELCRRHQPDEMPGPIAEEARAELLRAYQKMLSVRP